MECPFKTDIGLYICSLYSHYKIDGKDWAHFPPCCQQDCPLLHPELLGNLIWQDKNAPVV